MLRNNIYKISSHSRLIPSPCLNIRGVSRRNTCLRVLGRAVCWGLRWWTYIMILHGLLKHFNIALKFMQQLISPSILCFGCITKIHPMITTISCKINETTLLHVWFFIPLQQRLFIKLNHSLKRISFVLFWERVLIAGELTIYLWSLIFSNKTRARHRKRVSKANNLDDFLSRTYTWWNDAQFKATDAGNFHRCSTTWQTAM